MGVEEVKMKNKLTEWLIWKTQWRPPSRPEESENEAGSQALLLTLDWKQGSASQHLVIEVYWKGYAHKISRNTTVVKAVHFRKHYHNQYHSNWEVKSSQEVSVWPNWTRLGEVGSNTAKLRFTVGEEMGETHNERNCGQRKEIPNSKLAPRCWRN